MVSTAPPNCQPSIGRVVVVWRDKYLNTACLGGFHQGFDVLATVPLAWTLAPTRPQVAPSGLRKSFCGSVMTRAVRVRVYGQSRVGSWAKASAGNRARLKNRSNTRSNKSVHGALLVCTWGQVDCYVSNVYADRYRCANWYEACANPSKLNEIGKSASSITTGSTVPQCWTGTLRTSA